MFFIFSKILTLFIFPLPLFIFTGILFALVFGNTIKKKLILCLPPLLLWLFSTGTIAQALLQPLEDAYPPISPISLEKHDAIIVLGGMVNNLTRHSDRVELNSAADRLTDTIHLYNLKKADKIIFTGGSGFLFSTKFTEADQAERFFGQMGIPQKAILLEDQSRNTRENAIFTAKICKDLAINKVILITSAFHMKRSMAEFEKQGLAITAYPTDFRTLLPDIPIWEDIVPSTSALEKSTIAIKEWIGVIAYQLL
jgi:uncharacterized SAM-binding protein YcdF (DUF218 family)